MVLNDFSIVLGYFARQQKFNHVMFFPLFQNLLAGMQYIHI
jgi:hypothetical protein